MGNKKVAPNRVPKFAGKVGCSQGWVPAILLVRGGASHLRGISKANLLSIVLFGILFGALLLPIYATDLTQGETRKKAVVIPIYGEITLTQSAFVKRAVESAKNQKVDIVIFEIDTPGGAGDAMSMISVDIDKLGKIPSVAFIHPGGTSPISGAFSAGAYIALSTRRIYMSKGTAIGAAKPILMGAGGAVSELPESIEEKFVSAYREKFAAVAEKNGYPRNLAIKMVDRNWDVYEVKEEGQDGKRRYLTPQEIERERQDGKKFVYVSNEQVIPKGKLLTLSAEKAKEYGIATRIIENRSEIYKDFGIDNPIETQESFTWSENLAGFLTQPLLQTLLLIIGILGIWISIKTGDFGIFTAISIVAFAVLFFGSYVTGLADSTEMLIVVGGIILILLELFVIPGTSIPAIVGINCVFLGLILMLMPGIGVPDFSKEPWLAKNLMIAIIQILFAFISSALVFLTIGRYMPGIPFFSKFVLKTELQESKDLYLKNSHLLISKEGVARTSLRPSGKVEIDGNIWDVVADGAFIENGKKVKVIYVEGSRIVVEEVHEPSQAS